MTDQKIRTHEQILEQRRSCVRIVVTYMAAAFIFVGGIIVFLGSLFDFIVGDNLNATKDLYLTILPIATTVVTYWFASRKSSKDNNSNPEQTSTNPQQ